MQSATPLLEQVLDHIPAQWGTDAGQFFQDKIKEITQTPVKVAICGESGTGKSTLINTLRGLPPPPLGWGPPSDDPTLPAQVDIEECSMAPRAYRHPRFPSVEFWDLPGCGTVNFPIEEYPERVGLDRFDFYIIMDCGRFRSTDVFLADLIEQEYRKPFFFVRSKVDVDVDSERRRAQAHSMPFDPNQVLAKLRNGHIKWTLGHRADQVFFVSGHLEDAHLYDLPRLQQAVVESLPSKAQRNMLLLSLSSWSREMIEDKYHVLQAQTILFAAASAAAAAVPIPGLSIAVDVGILVSMGRHFVNSFGLSEQNAIAQGLMENASSAERVRLILSTTAKYATTKGIMALLKVCATQTAVEEVARYIPFVGTAVAASISFATTYTMGGMLLDQIKVQAEAFANEIVARAGADA